MGAVSCCPRQRLSAPTLYHDFPDYEVVFGACRRQYSFILGVVCFCVNPVVVVVQKPFASLGSGHLRDVANAYLGRFGNAYFGPHW